jgi:bifunctional non-homologous end joining protein LigD
MSNDNESASLFFKDGSSDKEYHAQLIAQDTGFVVNFQYGRRGAALQSGTKTAQPVEYAKAKRVYDKLVAEKVGRGYSSGTAGVPYSSPTSADFTGIVPQLLNPIPESAVMHYIKDDAYVMQEKFDGVHFLLNRTANGTVGINKRGLSVSYPLGLSAAMDKLQDALVEVADPQPFTACFDGERIGDKYYVFDLLHHKNKDLRNTPYFSRLATLGHILDAVNLENVIKVPTFFRTSEKLAEFNRIRAQGGEGVVFKRLTGISVPGKSAGSEDQIKFQFRGLITCFVTSVHDSKRSVGVSLRNSDADQDVFMGNVTIPVNHPIPVVGDLVEIQYLYAYRNGCLYQPVYQGKRTDQLLEDCVTSKLKYKAETAAAEDDEDSVE